MPNLNQQIYGARYKCFVSIVLISLPTQMSEPAACHKINST